MGRDIPRKAIMRRVKPSMSIKTYKPTTNGRRNMSVTDYSSLSKTGPEKSLLAPLNKKAGRNSYGRITVRHRGGGNRKKYRLIDFKRRKAGVPATVLTLNTIPTVPLSLPWCSMKTARRVILSLPTA